jgi:multidrug efflux pump subunit AcrB
VGLDALLALPMKAANGRMVPLSELVTVERGVIDQPRYTKNLLPVTYVMGDMAGKLDSPLYGLFGIRSRMDAAAAQHRRAGRVLDQPAQRPLPPVRHQVGRRMADHLRDLPRHGRGLRRGPDPDLPAGGGAVPSYITPLIIMAPIPLTIIGVMPGHALLGAQFTATSMIGMIALAGIIVRNSILLVDFIELETARGVPFADAVVQSAAVRAQPIALTGLAAMMGAFFILDDPIFNGLAISLIFGIAVSTCSRWW